MRANRSEPPIMEQVHADVAKIRETQALQGQILNTIMQRLDQNASMQAQQGAQIATLITQVEIIKNDHQTYRADVNTKLDKAMQWQSDATDRFVPRKEHEAANHEGRIKALEDAQQQVGERRFDFLQWLIANGIPIVFFLLMFVITVYGTFIKH